MELAAMFLPCVYAFVACTGFCALFNVRGKGALLCALGAALGWLVYLLAGPATGYSDYIQSLLASVSIALYAEIMARVRKCPVTPYVLIACLPLVPGAGIYYTMEYALVGDTQQFLDTFLHTLGLAGSMALGILLVGSAARLITGGRQGRYGKEGR